MQWKTFWSVIGCSVTSAVGVLPAAFDLPLPLTIAGAASAATGAVLAARREIHRSEMFLEMKLDAKDQMVRWVATAAGGHVAWVTGFQLKPGLWPMWIGALAGLGVMQYWIARWHEREQRRREVVAPVVQQQVMQQQEQENSAKIWLQIKETMHLSDLDHLELQRYEWIGTRGVRFWARKPPAAEMPKKKAAKELATPDMEDTVANSMSRVVRQDLNSRWVSITREETAGLYKFAIMNQDVMAQVIPYDEDLSLPLALTTLAEPAIQGFTIDGEPRFMRLGQHGQNIGLSGSGKSALTQCNLCHITRCSDAVSWICGTEKLYDLVSHWIEPFEGTNYRIPINWIAYGPQDTAEMLAAAMRIIRKRQRTRKGQRKGWKQIVITLDEATFALDPKQKKARAKFEGNTYHTTDLAAMILRAGKSAGVFLHLATQHGTHNNFGDAGSDVAAAFTFSNTFMSNDPAEVGRNTGDYQIPAPNNQGETIHTSPGVKPVRLKAPYPQEGEDESKELLHNGLTLSEVAWSRRGLDNELDAEAQEAAGDAYRRRHRYATPELFEYLTGEKPEPQSADQSLESVGKQAADAVLANLLGGQGGAATALPASPVPSGSDDAAPTSAEPVEAGAEEPVAAGQTARERIATIAVEFEGRLSKPDIAEQLKADGGSPVSSGVLANALTKMVEAGELHRPESGVYIAPGVEADDLVTVGD